jgi:hypothetical protein
MASFFPLPRAPRAGEGRVGVLQRESPHTFCAGFPAEAPPPQPSPALRAREGEGARA